MSQKRAIFTICLATVMLGFVGCKKKDPSYKPHRYVEPYKPVDTFGKSENFRLGVYDGCLTADGKYTKNHNSFNTNLDYYNGWFAGRRNCEGRPAKYRMYTPS